MSLLSVRVSVPYSGQVQVSANYSQSRRLPKEVQRNPVLGHYRNSPCYFSEQESSDPEENDKTSCLVSISIASNSAPLNRILSYSYLL